MWDYTYRTLTALMSSNGNIHISNMKQSYKRITGITWNTNTCNRNNVQYNGNLGIAM